ncbi:MAG: Clp protease ClpP [Pisciglobus halotolerans]|nr:Clp protease ClpP [Pisciglobus halotolerans]
MNRNELFIYGAISSKKEQGTVTSFEVREFLSKADKSKPLIVRVNSPGGEIAEGVTIHNMIERFNDDVSVYIDGLAASIASVIAMAGNKVYMSKNASMMIHNASVGVSGNSKELRKMASVLDKMSSTIRASYTKRDLTVNDDELTKMMDEETWLTAAEAVEKGFVDEVVRATKQTASITPFLEIYNNIPEKLKGGDDLEEETKTTTVEEEKEADVVTKEAFDELVERVIAIEKQLDDKEQTEERTEEPEAKIDSFSRFFF